LVGAVYRAIAERLTKVENVERATDNSPKVNRQGNMISYQHGELESGVREEGNLVRAKDSNGREFKVEEVKSGEVKTGRNDPCPCGSGKKYKNCHGK
jgi:uncharacterized protein YecA (UPF0149 family)